MNTGRVPGLRRLASLTPRTRSDVVLFDSWSGSYSDNPRAISEELHRRRDDLTHVWVLNEASSAKAPEWAVRVEPESLAHLQWLGRAGCLIANNTMPGYYRKPSGARYIQTWHGTPLKRIAFDIERPQFPRPEQYFRGLRRDVERWDCLLSPNRFSTDILRSAFRYKGRIAETGYPRNDLLASAASHRVRASIRQELGVEPAQQVVLYAPTFRDGTGFSLALELGEMAAQLGDETVLLLRAHHLDAAGDGFGDKRRVRDVSRIPDIRELYLAADVLITDYSSVMFDFAVTRKPMLFFTYDLDVYRDKLRGFYFDFEAAAPGPLLSTTEEVIETLRDLPAVVARHQEAYARFVERFCHLDDGGASGRVVDLLLESDSA